MLELLVAHSVECSAHRTLGTKEVTQRCKVQCGELAKILTGGSQLSQCESEGWLRVICIFVSVRRRQRGRREIR